MSIDVSGAWKIDGVEAVITAEDVPGKPTYGLIAQDQPVFASEVVRFVGEPVAAVAANHPEICRRALAAIVVTYEVLDPLTDPEVAIAGGHEPIHPDGNVIRHQRILRGDQTLVGDVVVEATYEMGMQDQAFLGLESALALPGPGGASVELYVATQWLHEDRKQIAACLGLEPEAVLLTLGGVGGAFGAREDISLQVHSCLLALRTGRPVRMAYSREESFLGHVHRHPAKIWMRHHADARRQAAARRVPAGARRRGVRVHVVGRADQRGHPRAGAVQVRARHGGRLRGAHQQPAVRGDARLRCGAGVLRPRGADGQARGRMRHRSGRPSGC